MMRIAAQQLCKAVFYFEIVFGGPESAVNLRVFGAGDAAKSPEATGDFMDEADLKHGGGLEFIEQVCQEPIVFLPALFEVRGFDNDVSGVKAVGSGISA